MVLLPGLGGESECSSAQRAECHFAMTFWENRGGSWRGRSASGQREAWKAAETAGLVKRLAPKPEPLGVTIQVRWQPRRRRDPRMRWVCRCRPYSPLRSGFGESWQPVKVQAADRVLRTVRSHSFRVTGLLPLSTWHKSVTKGKPGEWEGHGTGVLVGACPRCWI